LTDLTSYELPSYPAGSIRRSAEGLVALDVVVGAEGRVTSVNVYIAPDDAIRGSVEQTLSHWRFRRATVHGIAHPCLARLVIYFRLVDGIPKVIVPGLTDSVE
jgi:TonB family protein